MNAKACKLLRQLGRHLEGKDARYKVSKKAKQLWHGMSDRQKYLEKKYIRDALTK